MSDTKLAEITPEELSLVKDNTLNPEQLQLLLKKTPADTGGGRNERLVMQPQLRVGR